MGNAPAQFDTSIEIVTPENIAFRYRVAGPFRRLPAYLIDLLIRCGVAGAGTIGLAVLLGMAGLGAGWVAGASLILWFVLAWFYGGLFETCFNGQTPGKRLMQIRVVSIDGQPINGLQAVLRNVLREVDAQPITCYLAGLLACAMNHRFQRLGDLACGTIVVVEERPWFEGVVRSGEPEAVRLAGAIPANFQPSRTLARALAAYVQRRRTFSWPRRLEIAGHLGEPLREQLNLPANTNSDLLLCALYDRTFFTDQTDLGAREGSPFMEPQDTSYQLAVPLPVGELPENR